jgi:hypothetical protein
MTSGNPSRCLPLLPLLQSQDRDDAEWDVRRSYLEGLTSEDFEELRQGEQASKFIAAVESLTVGVGR